MESANTIEKKEVIEKLKYIQTICDIVMLDLISITPRLEPVQAVEMIKEIINETIRNGQS